MNADANTDAGTFVPTPSRQLSRAEVIAELQKRADRHLPRHSTDDVTTEALLEQAVAYLKKCPWPSCGFCYTVEHAERRHNVDLPLIGEQRVDTPGRFRPAAGERGE